MAENQNKVESKNYFCKSVEIKNYKKFEDCTISFSLPDQNKEGSGLNILIGNNGCGKTTILEAINLLLEKDNGEIVKNISYNDIHDSKKCGSSISVIGEMSTVNNSSNNKDRTPPKKDYYKYVRADYIADHDVLSSSLFKVEKSTVFDKRCTVRETKERHDFLCDVDMKMHKVAKLSVNDKAAECQII